jgi:hypothetical protein
MVIKKMIAVFLQVLGEEFDLVALWRDGTLHLLDPDALVGRNACPVFLQKKRPRHRCGD